MTSYFNRLIGVMILCQITTVITPDSERTKQSIRILCALISFLTLLSPLRSITTPSEQLHEKFSAVLDTNFVSRHTEKEADSIHFLQYITTHYDVEEVSMILYTDDTDTQIVKLELYVKNYPYTSCTVMELELQELLNIPVIVFGE